MLVRGISYYARMPKPRANQAYVYRKIRIPARLLAWSKRAGVRNPHDPELRAASRSSKVLRDALDAVFYRRGGLSPILRADPVSETTSRVGFYGPDFMVYQVETLGADLSATISAGLEYLRAHPQYFDMPSTFKPIMEPTMPNLTIGVTIHPETFARLDPVDVSAQARRALTLCYGDPPELRAGAFGSRSRMPRGGPRRRSLTLTLPADWVTWLRRPGCNASATADQALQLLQALE